MRRAVLSIGVVLSAIGCTSSTEARSNPLLGSWASDVVALSPSGTMQTTYKFSANGEVGTVTRTFGLYDRRSPNELASYSYSVGRYRVEGTTIVLDVARRVTWDRFYGDDSPPREEEISPAFRKQEVKFSIDGDRLTLEYFSFPLDAPVLTRVSYTRE